MINDLADIDAKPQVKFLFQMWFVTYVTGLHFGRPTTRHTFGASDLLSTLYWHFKYHDASRWNARSPAILIIESPTARINVIHD